MATIKGIYELIKKDQLEGKEIGLLNNYKLKAEQSKKTKEVLTFIKNVNGGDDGNN
jgi:hypothetical protein